MRNRNKKHEFKELENLSKYVNCVDFGNVLNKFEDISLVDPLDTLKSIEIGLYCLKSDTLDKFVPRPFVKDRNLL
jgi:hypothetical protein